MSKAEDRALERFPVHEGASKEWVESHLKGICSDYIEGYHQAEKDLELGWEDIRIILDIENDILCECNSQKELVIETYPKGEDYYGEILERFNKERKEL